MISFTNSGEIDPRLITTLGCNVKEGDSPIGYFGTGLKYAIAVLLREKQQITIWSGLVKLEFGLRLETIRGKDFQLVTMNDLPLGYTTEYGKNWTVENAYRELWCNTKDEGGETIVGGGAVQPCPGRTWIQVSGESFARAHHARWEFLLDPSRQPLFSVPDLGEIYSGSSSKIFYRGVATSRSPGGSPTRYTYNLLKKQKLTEDRTLASDWDSWCQMGELLGRCPLKPVLVDSLKDEKGGEQHFRFSYAAMGEPFYEVVGALYHTHRSEMNSNAREAFIVKKGKPKPNWRKMTMESHESEALQAGLEFWAGVGFQISDYPIHLAHSIKDGDSSRILACAEDGQIWLTPECFANEELLRAALVEEYIHLRSQVSDETRDMQNVLFAELQRVARLVHG